MSPFDNAYDVTAHEREPFGAMWCGPLQLKHGVVTPVAVYHGQGDGQTCTVFCTAMPARFYAIQVAPGPNSVGTQQPGYRVETGSGMADAAALVACQIAAGMLGFAPTPN